jgi:hypothetical protein
MSGNAAVACLKPRKGCTAGAALHGLCLNVNCFEARTCDTRHDRLGCCLSICHALKQQTHWQTHSLIVCDTQ